MREFDKRYELNEFHSVLFPLLRFSSQGLGSSLASSEIKISLFYILLSLVSRQERHSKSLSGSKKTLRLELNEKKGPSVLPPVYFILSKVLISLLQKH
jgi:hypothetical protein